MQIKLLKRTFLIITTLSTMLSLENGFQSSFAATKKTKTSAQKSDLLQEMHQKYKNVQTLTAEFTQIQKNSTDGSIKESTGRIFIKRPGMFRWQTLKPDPSLLVGNGHKVWYYTPPFRDGEHGQVLVRRAAEAQSKLAVDLLGGQAELKKEFKIKELPHDSYELTPLKPAGNIDHIVLTVERPTNLVYKLVLFTTTGNETALTLNNMTLSPSLSDQMFNFTPPPNTEEIK